MKNSSSSFSLRIHVTLFFVLNLVLVPNIFAQFGWTQLSYGGGWPYSIYFHNADIGWISDEWGAINKTTDGGLTWIAYHPLPWPAYVADVTAIQFLDEYIGYAVDDGGLIFKTTDGGENWIEQNSGVTSRLSAMHFVDQNTGWIVGVGGVILKTIDGGSNWSAQSSTVTNDLNTIVATDGLTAWTGGGNGTILKTDNGGSSWVHQGSFGFNFQVEDFYAFSSLHVLGVARNWGGGSGLFRTTNGGANWELSSLPVGGVCVHFSDANHGFAIADLSLFKTTDGGYSWTTLPPYGGNGVYSIDENITYFINYFPVQVFKTTNGGNPNYGGGAAFGGYYFANSTFGSSGAPSQPTFNWITETSNEVNITAPASGNQDDGYWGPIALPFSFEFFQTSYNELYITTNGYIQFGAPSNSIATNKNIPYQAAPNNIIAFCWDDMKVNSNFSHIYYGGNNSEFVITYDHLISSEDSLEYLTCQVILSPNGNILLQYNDGLSSASRSSFENDCSIGIENSSGFEGLVYRYNGYGAPMFSSNLAVMFGLDPQLLPVENEINSIPGFRLSQNYPNPFNPITTIRFEIPFHEGVGYEFVTLRIYDILGRELTTLVNEPLASGIYDIVWDGRNFSSGVYFYILNAGKLNDTKKMILVK